MKRDPLREDTPRYTHWRLGLIPRNLMAEYHRVMKTDAIPFQAQLVAFVRHNYSNYDLIGRRYHCRHDRHVEWKKWVDAQIVDALRRRGDIK